MRGGDKTQTPRGGSRPQDHFILTLKEEITGRRGRVSELRRLVSQDERHGRCGSFWIYDFFFIFRVNSVFCELFHSDFVVVFFFFFFSCKNNGEEIFGYNWVL